MDSPLAPVTERGDTLAWLQLTLLPGLSAAEQRLLLRHFGTPARALASPPQALAAVVGWDAARLVAKGARPALIERALDWLEQPGHHLIALGDPRYPRGWLETADPPNAFYAMGRVELLNVPSIAVVGSRNATPQGLRDAHAFAQALSEFGLTVVSGLALGIDAQAHRGGLAGRGSSIAVIGTGADRVYPGRNRELAHALARDGCVVTEFPLGMPPLAGNFPRRNRLISGLARGVLVVEAAEESGSLITARFAADQSRDVFAIPGSIHSPLAKGCHKLIKEGAKLVESAQDLLVELGLAEHVAGEGAADGECDDAVLVAMGFAPTTIDRLARSTGTAVGAIGAELTRLELEGRIVALAGGWFQRVAL